MRLQVLVGLALLSVCIPVAARAEGPRFGGAGQLAITDDQPLGGVSETGFLTPTPPGSTSTVSFEFASISDGGGSGTAFAVAPAADYFVVPNLSLGANIVFGVVNPAHPSGSTSTSVTLFGIAPRIGYNLSFTDVVSWWPKVYFGYITESASGSGTNSSSSSVNQTAIGVFAPVMFQPSPHFILGIGPNFSTQLSSNSSAAGTSVSQPKVTQVGVQATVGGWCLGD